MIVLKERTVADAVPCPYISGQEFVQEYFFAYDLSEREYEDLLSGGWRRFGFFFFRPACVACRACRPLRVDVQRFAPSRSQKRVLRRNRETRKGAAPLGYRNEFYDLYKAHTRERFRQPPSEEDDFVRSFFTPAAPALQMEYFRGDSLAGLGLLDKGAESFSSVYFVFDPLLSSLSLGTFSILAELELAKKLGLRWYYLGYWIEENPSMAYKNRFRPYQLYQWDEERWVEP